METFSALPAICAGFPVNSPHKGQWRGALMFSLICVWINDWVNNREAGDLRRYRAHYDVIVMRWLFCCCMSKLRLMCSIFGSSFFIHHNNEEKMWSYGKSAWVSYLINGHSIPHRFIWPVYIVHAYILRMACVHMYMIPLYPLCVCVVFPSIM